MLGWSKKIPSPQEVKERYQSGVHVENYIRFKQNTGFNYDYLFSYMDKISDLVEPDSEKILDMGCGAGPLLNKLRKKNKGRLLYGLDISHPMLQQIDRSLHPVRGDLFHLPFVSDSIDCLVCTTVSELFNDDDFEKITKEARRIVKKGGHLIILYKNPTSFWEPYWWLYKYNYYQNSYSREKIRTHGHRVGLTVKKVMGTYLAAPPLIYRNHLSWYKNLFPSFLLKLLFTIDYHFLSKLFPFLCRHYIVVFEKRESP